MYWSTRWRARQSQRDRCVSEMNTMVSAPVKRQIPYKQGARPHSAASPHCVSLNFRPTVKAYQGTIFLSPFFFLLVDSFLLFPFVPACIASCAVAPSVLGASVAWPAVAVVASVFGAPSAVPAAAAPSAGFSAVAGGAFGSGCAVAGAASFPSVVGATFSALPVAAPAPPGIGVTSATIPVPPPPTRAWLPPFKI